MSRKKAATKRVTNRTRTTAKKRVATKSAAGSGASPRKQSTRKVGAARKASATATRKSTRKSSGSTRKTVAKKRVGTAPSKLAKYREMRKFDVTPEPSGERISKRAADGLRFVVQKHAASHLHYDFRLELDGVLLSWSIPKGPSLRAGDRRLAVRTEDHPLDYADFEGVIPKGQYGGGSVIVWDNGTWIPEGDARASLKKGRITFALKGEKLSGRFHLVRSKAAENKRENWLLLKSRDESASNVDVVVERPESVLSGKTVEEIGEPARAQVKAKPENVTDMVEMVGRLQPGFALTNLDKVLYPEQGLRKAEIIAYYVSVASVMLPHIQKRPLVLVRCPNGSTQQCFYQKHIEKGVPDAVQRVRIKESKKTMTYPMVQDINGLIALAQLGVLEIHLWGCHVDHVEKPDLFVFDLDPDEALHFDVVRDAALELRDLLHTIGLTSFVKTTGGKGLHVVAPIARQLSWDQHKAVSHAIVEQMARKDPKRFLTNMRKDLRKGKIFLDYLRNGRGATAIAPYSTRARSGAYVATPLRWDELERGAKPSDFDVRSVLRRLEEQKLDPWHAFFDVQQSLPAGLVKGLVKAA